jgi:hypothetical protein
LLDFPDQDLGLERLGDKIIRPGLGPLVLVISLESPSQQDDRHRTQRGFRPQSGTHLVPILVRHDQIQENEVRTLFLGLADRLLTTARLDEDERLFAEGQLHDLLDRHTIIGHKNSRGHAILLCEGATHLRSTISYLEASSSRPGRRTLSSLLRQST